MTTDTISPREVSAPAEIAEHLQATTAAVRISFEWFGVRKTLSTDQKAQAAQPFGAEGQYLSAAKKLLDTKHVAFKAVTVVKGRIVSYWKGMTLPFPVTQVMEFLQANKAFVNTTDEHGRTPLHIAAGAGNLELVKFLITLGANVEAEDMNGDTPLHRAYCPEVVSMILSGAPQLFGHYGRLMNWEKRPCTSLHPKVSSKL